MATIRRLKTRVKLKHFMRGSLIQASWVVEAHEPGEPWRMVGDERGVTKHESREAAEAVAKELESCEVQDS